MVAIQLRPGITLDSQPNGQAKRMVDAAHISSQVEALRQEWIEGSEEGLENITINLELLFEDIQTIINEQ